MSASPSPADRPARPRRLLLLALISGGSLMWPVVTAGPLALDEHVSYWLIDTGNPGDTMSRCLNYAATPPLSSWLEMAFLQLFGRNELVFRLPSALCYLAAILVTYGCGVTVGNRWTGGIAALLLAWHPEALDEVRIARCYGLVLLLSAVLLWVTSRWLRRAPSWCWPLAWGLTSAALIWTHYTAAPLIGCLGLSLPFMRDSRSTGRPRALEFVLACSVPAVLSLPLIPAALRLREWGPFLNYMSGDQPVWNTIGPLWWLGLPVGLLLAWGLARALGNGPRGDSMPVLWLAVWTLVPLLGLALLARGDLSSLVNPRYRMPYAPGGACLISLLLWRACSRPAVTFAAAIAVLAAAWWSSDSAPWKLRRLGDPTDRQWKTVAERIDVEGTPGEALLVQSGLVESSLVPVFHADPMFMEYAACRAGRFYIESSHPRAGLPFLWDKGNGVVEFYRSRLRSIAVEEPGSFWVASATDTDLNRNSLEGIQRLADEAGFTPVAEYRQPAVTLLHFRRRAD